MKIKKLSLVLITLFLGLIGTALGAETIEELTFQGRLTGSDGNPLNGGKKMSFILYKAADTNAQPLFEWYAGSKQIPANDESKWYKESPYDTYQIGERSESIGGDIPVYKGIYAVRLPFSKPILRYALAAEDSLWIEVRVQGANGQYETLAPRVKVASSMFAMMANQVKWAKAKGQSNATGLSYDGSNTFVGIGCEPADNFKVSIKGPGGSGNEGTGDGLTTKGSLNITGGAIVFSDQTTLGGELNDINNVNDIRAAGSAPKITGFTNINATSMTAENGTFDYLNVNQALNMKDLQLKCNGIESNGNIVIKGNGNNSHKISLGNDGNIVVTGSVTLKKDQGSGGDIVADGSVKIGGSSGAELSLSNDALTLISGKKFTADSGISCSGTISGGTISGTASFGSGSIGGVTFSTDKEIAQVKSITGIGSSDSSCTITGFHTINASKVQNAVWNDLAEFRPLAAGSKKIAGRAYLSTAKGLVLPTKRCQQGVVGICSDTYGFSLGGKPEDKGKVPIAISGWALAYVDKAYPIGTALVNGKDGILTKATFWEKTKYPERILAVVDMGPAEYNNLKIDGRTWVKVR